MLAAMALANDLPLYTCNPADSAASMGLTWSRWRYPNPARSSPGPACFRVEVCRGSTRVLR